MLLLGADKEKVWTTEEVDRKLNLTSSSAKHHLDEMLAAELLERVDPDRYRFHPASIEMEKTVSELANAYTTQRVAVLTMIFATRVDKVRLFRETFRIINGEQ